MHLHLQLMHMCHATLVHTGCDNQVARYYLPHRRIQDCFPRGAVKLVTQTGVQGAGPMTGVARGRAPLRREICIMWTQFARFGAYQHYIENLFIYFQ